MRKKSLLLVMVGFLSTLWIACSKENTKSNRSVDIERLSMTNYQVASSTPCELMSPEAKGKKNCYELFKSDTDQTFAGKIKKNNEAFTLVDNMLQEYAMTNGTDISDVLTPFIDQTVKLLAKLQKKEIYLEDMNSVAIREFSIEVNKEHVVIFDLSGTEFSCSLRFPQNCRTLTQGSEVMKGAFRLDWDNADTYYRVKAMSGSRKDQLFFFLDGTLLETLKGFADQIFTCDMSFDTLTTEDKAADGAPVFTANFIKSCEAKALSGYSSFAETCVDQGLCKSSTIVSETSVVNKGYLTFASGVYLDRLVLDSTTDNTIYYLSAQSTIDYLSYVGQYVLVTGTSKVFSIVTNLDQTNQEAVIFVNNIELQSIKDSLIRINLMAKNDGSGTIKFVNALNGEEEFEFGFGFKGTDTYTDGVNESENAFFRTAALTEISNQSERTILETTGIVSEYKTKEGTTDVVRVIQPITVIKRGSDGAAETVFPQNSSTNLPKDNDVVKLVSAFSTIRTAAPSALMPSGWAPDRYFVEQLALPRTLIPYIDTIVDGNDVRLILLDDNSSTYSSSVLMNSASSPFRLGFSVKSA